MTNKLILLGTLAYPWIKAKIGNGERIYFWSSNWSPYSRIRDYISSEPPNSLGIPSNSTLAELWEIDHWVLPAARSDNQVRIIAHLSSLTITEALDHFEWCPDDVPSEKYSTKLVYNLVRESSPVVPWHKEIWFSGGIPKHKFLYWLMTLNRCPIKDRMIQWGLQIDGACVLCNAASESRNHLYFRCSYSSGIWAALASRCSFTPSPDWE